MCELTRPWNWLIFKIINPALGERLERHARGSLLDIGCGTKPYAEMAAPFVSRHVGLEHEESLHGTDSADLVGSAYDIPSADMAFDTVLCTDVLEHLERPQAAVHEAFRVLAPGAFAIYTTPLFWHLHEEPRDFYRYTKYGLQFLFREAGFEIIEIVPLTGFVVTFSQALVYFLYRHRGRTKLNPLHWLVPPLGWLVQKTAYALHHLEKGEAFTMEYLLVAQKPREDRGQLSDHHE